jgi:TolB-like protein
MMPRRLFPPSVWLLSSALLLATGLSNGRAAAASPADRSPPPPTTIAVLYFDYAGHDQTLEPLKKGLAQMLITDLAVVDTLRVVERERLQALLEEQKLAKSGKIDAGTAARIGKLLGARYLVLGSYFDALGAFRVDARIVSVETGEIVKSVGANGNADDFLGLEQKLADGLREATGKLAQGTGGGRRAADAPAARPDRRVGPKPPRRLNTETAVTYGRALVAMDDGDKKTARTLFRTVLTAQPDFELAQRDFDRLIQ